MPPLSPDPGWTSGDVWSESTATLRTEIKTLPSRSTFRECGRCWSVPGGDEALVHVEQRLALLSGQILVGGDRLANTDARLVVRRQETGAFVQRLGADLQGSGDLLEDLRGRLAQAALDLRQVRIADTGEIGQAANAHPGHLALRLDQVADVSQLLVQVLRHQGNRPVIRPGWPA